MPVKKISPGWDGFFKRRLSQGKNSIGKLKAFQDTILNMCISFFLYIMLGIVN
jgi:hypothetical protein